MEVEVVREFADLRTIVLNCKECQTSIAHFGFVENYSRREWLTFSYLVEWKVLYEVSPYGEMGQ